MKKENGNMNEIAFTENEYSDLLKTAVAQINTTRNALALQVNTTVNSTYWNLGKLLHERKIEGGYGSNIINRLSVDLKTHFPEMGLSPRNLWNMKRFYQRYSSASEKLQRSVAVLSWRIYSLCGKRPSRCGTCIAGHKQTYCSF